MTVIVKLAVFSCLCALAAAQACTDSTYTGNNVKPCEAGHVCLLAPCDNALEWEFACVDYKDCYTGEDGADYQAALAAVEEAAALRDAVNPNKP